MSALSPRNLFAGRFPYCCHAATPYPRLRIRDERIEAYERSANKRPHLAARGVWVSLALHKVAQALGGRVRGNKVVAPGPEAANKKGYKRGDASAELAGAGDAGSRVLAELKSGRCERGTA